MNLKIDLGSVCIISAAFWLGLTGTGLFFGPVFSVIGLVFFAVFILSAIALFLQDDGPSYNGD